jgi:TonB family protein
MPEGQPASIPHPAPVPRFVVELPSWPHVFLGNLRDLLRPGRLPSLELRSAPAAFWDDVFIERRLPWLAVFQSVSGHVVAFALLIALTRFFALQPRAVVKPTLDHAEVVYPLPAANLPPLDTRRIQPAPIHKADPAFSHQPIISVPPESDNRSQTIVTPPNIKLHRDVALPNIVAWSDAPQKPRLAIPDAPLTLAADIRRLAPLPNSVVAPPPDARFTDRRNHSTLQASVVAPPPDLQAETEIPMTGPQPAVIAPPPAVQTPSPRRLGDLNIGRSAVIAPAPQLAVAEQRAVAGGLSSVLAPQVVPPPPSVAASGASGQSFGARGRVIALNLHPVIGAPPDPPAGNRRGSFAAAHEGHPGASGTPGSSTNAGGKSAGSGSNAKGISDLPAGLYVGKAADPAKPSPVGGTSNAASHDSVNPNLLAGARPPRLTSAPRLMQPGNLASLTDVERQVFSGRRFYSVTLNMPNLNSGGGSWIIRFAELRQDQSSPAVRTDPPGNSSPSDPPASAQADLSQPMAIRKVDPAYPLQLMRENVAGTVIVYGVIHADGTVGSVRVLRGVDPRLDQFAKEAVAQWRFQPATKNGAPIDVEATFQIPFRPVREDF